ncbi:amidohydrolase family protein [Frankia sp. AgKG'84/4]|uniref:amidohydrolase family protein n=1 Tax=Frankia sp. AgKG'84/4 TaxID=573490 RepID=UPI00200E0E34|nr:amidohydrolase family protein [Frankia sp. AgKG'84/4]MCL9793054.1 amidohydrolase [Frankia sp. AgKG'84/4]
MASSLPNDRYTVISSDTHAGGSHAQYREFLDSRYHEDFDAWRGKYRNPFSDLGDNRRLRNWDDDMRNSQQDQDGIVGEVIFPNTVPPFFPNFVLFAEPPKPEEYLHRRAGIQAHNRWLDDFCSRYPERRAGVGQIFLNDIDDAIEDATWIKEHGLRGGVLLPPVPPHIDWIKPLNHPDYDRLWAVCEDLEIPLNVHGGQGLPSYMPHPSSALLMTAEMPYFSHRPLSFLLLSGVFERFPRLKFIMTEQGCGWLPPTLRQWDRTLERVRTHGALGELRFKPEHRLPKSATEYFQQNVWLGVSFPHIDDVRAATEHLGVEKFMWGSDFPHDEGTFPYTTLHLRQLFSDWTEADLRKILAENVASIYDFDLAALAEPAALLGPRVEDVRRPLTELPENPNEALLTNAAAV